MVPCAYLRVYESLEALPVAERDVWLTRIQQGRGVVSRVGAPAVEAKLSRVGLPTGRAPSGSGTAIVRRVDGSLHVCPLRLDLRAAETLDRLRRTVPDSVLTAFVPDAEVREGLGRLSRTGRHPHVRDSAWVVPPEWFVAFDPEERRIVDAPGGCEPRLTYVTRIARAAHRLERAAEIVGGTLADPEWVLEQLAEVAVWLDGFASSSLLELDYGGLAPLFGGVRLREDRSCEDVWEALHALDDGAPGLASLHYGALRSRWHHARQRRRAS